MNLAVIPARGGSRRIPGKNIRLFCGKPMMAWTIRAARKSGVFDHIIVSTDDEEIATVARNLGAEVPFMRPASLADGRTPLVPVMRHAIEADENRIGEPASVAACLLATAPMMRPEDLLGALGTLSENPEADFVFSVASYPFPIQRALKLGGENRVSMFQPEHELTRSQDLEEAYHDAGQFYFARRDAWFDHDRIFSARSFGFVLPRHRVQDIDTEEDWTRAELMFKVMEELQDG